MEANEAVRTHDQRMKLLWLLCADELVQFLRFQNEAGLHSRWQTLELSAQLGASLSSLRPLRLMWQLMTDPFSQQV